ncbi:Gdpd4 [Phodopus roborovskii]|uniref:Gdpd4 protein n=1 Tax=Phodopus roborovskii TaxID=109678 RepID=A0AAU9ZKV0_PHORO|nr:Gdpd4 [Phodopus roborovskii]
MHNDITESKNKTTGKSNENPNLWIERFFNRRCYITFLTGCYSCHWQYREWEKTELGSCCCSWKEQFFYLCLVISFILSAVFLFVWAETSNEYNSFDWVVYLGIKRWFLWSIFMLSAAGILTVYTTLLLVISFFLLWERIELYLHMCHKILILLVILLCSFLLAILNKYWTDKWLIAGLSLQIFAPFVHLSLLTVMIILSWPLAIIMAHLESEVRIRRYKMSGYEHEIEEGCPIFTRLQALQVAAGLPFLLILLCLYLMPMGIYSPCVLKRKDLGPKPTFFGHRGAPMLAPENTMMSFEKAVEHGASGLETDIYLSVDEVPFLMHDQDVSRTTNIREVLPSSAFNHAATFNWTFLSSLNAGKWFIKILWLPGFDRDYVRYKAPGFQHVGRLLSLEELAKQNITIINVDYKRLFYRGLRHYKAAKIHINVYVVNEPWLFSLAWCYKINSVTTDNIQTLNQLNRPLFFMTPGYYTFMWLFLDITSAVIIGFVFYYHWMKELRKARWLETDADTTVSTVPICKPNQTAMKQKLNMCIKRTEL